MGGRIRYREKIIFCLVNTCERTRVRQASLMTVLGPRSSPPPQGEVRQTCLEGRVPDNDGDGGAGVRTKSLIFCIKIVGENLSFRGSLGSRG